MLRTARPDEIGWINEQYARVGFIPSDPAHEEIVVAELDGVRAGIGRLVDLGSGVRELGGMYVFDAFRGRGVARAIIEELIRRAGAHPIYCIPFADLEPVYTAAGFRQIDVAAAPAKIREKVEWCERELDRGVLVMKR